MITYRESDQLTPDSIRAQVARKEAQRDALKVEMQALALAAVERDTSAIDRRATVAEQDAELAEEIKSLQQALPSSIRRECEAAHREFQARFPAVRHAYDKEGRLLHDTVARLAMTPVPTEADLLALKADGIAFNGLRQTLYDLTGDATFAKPRNVLDELRWSWFEQARQRDRLFDRLRGVKPAPPATSWATDLERLRAVHQHIIDLEKESWS